MIAALTLSAAMLFACGEGKTTSNKELPLAKFTATPTSARPQVIKLDASESTATVGTISAYRWTFGDEAEGAAARETTVPSEVHAYAATGTFTVTLVVLDDKGTASEPFTQQVTISSVNTAAPKAIIVGPGTATPGSPVLFDGSASTPKSDLVSYAWSFDDPLSVTQNTASTVQAAHTFATAGNYRVKLTVTDSLGQSDTAELLIAVGQAGPQANCTWMPSAAQQGVPVTFDGSGSTAPTGATIKTYLWDFGDGSPQATGVTTSHTYNAQATFKPTLQIIDSQNRVADAACPDVVVGAPPLCVADYAISANPKTQPCGIFGNTTWAGVQMHIEEKADGTITGTENFNGQMIVYSGTWSGTSFTMKGSYDQDAGGDTIHTEATINGAFTGCGTWMGTWVEDVSSAALGPLCTLTWNVTGTKL